MHAGLRGSSLARVGSSGSDDRVQLDLHARPWVCRARLDAGRRRSDLAGRRAGRGAGHVARESRVSDRVHQARTTSRIAAPALTQSMLDVSKPLLRLRCDIGGDRHGRADEAGRTGDVHAVTADDRSHASFRFRLRRGSMVCRRPALPVAASRPKIPQDRGGPAIRLLCPPRFRFENDSEPPGENTGWHGMGASTNSRTPCVSG
jgi:hypothetical protein